MSKISDAVAEVSAVVPRNDPCFLVGQFIQDWAFLEREISKGVERLVGVETLEAAILLANMQVRDKIYALKTLLYVFAPDDDARDASVKLIKRVNDLNDGRNIVAHNMFWRHDGGGVEFSIVRAKGKLNFPNVVWSEGDFAEKSREISAVKTSLRSAVAKAARLRALASMSKVQNIFATSGGMFGRGLAGDEGSDVPSLVNALTHRLVASPGSPPASPETPPQKRPRKQATKPKPPRPKAKG